MLRAIKVHSVILANLVVGDNVVPEFLQEDCTPEKLSPRAARRAGGFAAAAAAGRGLRRDSTRSCRPATRRRARARRTSCWRRCARRGGRGSGGASRRPQDGLSACEIHHLAARESLVWFVPSRSCVPAGLGDIEFDKANATPEANGARVCPVHADMHRTDPPSGRQGKPGSKHPRSGPAPLKAWQQIQMDVGRIGLRNGGWCRFRMVYREEALLIVGPFGHSRFIRCGIVLT